MATQKKSILVPYDFSNDSANALEVAYQIASRQDHDITLLHVIEIPRYPYVEPEFSEAYTSQLRDMAMHHLSTLPKTGMGNQTSLQLLVEVGHPSKTILNFIKKEKIGLVVMGSQGVHSLGKSLAGSTTEKIVRYARCPVLTVKNKIDLYKIKDIVLATDFETTPLFITRKLSMFSNLLGAKLHLLKINTRSEWKTTRQINHEMEAFAKIHGLEDYVSEVYDDQSAEEGIVNYAEEVDAGMVAMPVHNLARVSALINGYYTTERVFNDTNKLLWTYAYDNQEILAEL